MREDIEVRPYKHGDEEGIVQLLQLSFSGWPRFDLNCTSLDHWKWKYLENPYRDNYIGLGLLKKKIIGVDHAIPSYVKIGDKTHLCSYGADVVVHPEYRRMGVYRRVRDIRQKLAEEAGVILNYHVTSNPIIIKNNIRAGRPYFPKKIISLVRIIDINEHIMNMPVKNSWYLKLGYIMSKKINEIKNSLKKAAYEDDHLEITTVNEFGEGIASFLNKISNHHNFMVQKSMNYMNWRYCDPRAGNFLVRQIDGENNEILGYCVLSENRTHKGYTIGYVVDMLSLPERLDVADALIKDAVAYFDGKQVNIVSSLMVKNHPYEAVFTRNGFLDSRFELKLFYRQLRDDGVLDEVEKSSPSKIHFSYGDIDSLPASVPEYG